MLMDNGKLMRKQFAKSKIDLSEFLMTARQAGYFDLSEVKSAILEYNGKISFLPYAENAPLTPSTAAHAPADVPVFYPIILDGKLIGERLRALGFRTAAMALTDDSVSIEDEALMAEPKLAIVLGTEGDGLAQTTIAACDYTVKIPMSHKVDSLNVAAAGALAFWQLRAR